MRRFVMAHVGDGLCCVLCTPEGYTFQIDWGSQQGAASAASAMGELQGLLPSFPAANFPDAFALSHFHTDHYNSLLLASLMTPPPPWFRALELVILPGLPLVPSRQEFALALTSTCLRILGNDSGHREYDLLIALSRFNSGRSFMVRRVFQGDVFRVGSMEIKCSWPPKQLNSASMTNKMEIALRRFSEALEVDHELAEIHSSIRDHSPFFTLEAPIEIAGEEQAARGLGRIPDGNIIPARRAIPGVTLEANKALKDVADSMSLAMSCGSQFAFLGDLPAKQIRLAVAHMTGMGPTDFEVFVPPHHGTRWEASLSSIRANMTLVPNGRKMHEQFRPEFASISRSLKTTYTNRDTTWRF
jgi:hypothetical protein